MHAIVQHCLLYLLFCGGGVAVVVEIRVDRFYFETNAPEDFRPGAIVLFFSHPYL